MVKEALVKDIFRMHNSDCQPFLISTVAQKHTLVEGGAPLSSDSGPTVTPSRWGMIHFIGNFMVFMTANFCVIYVKYWHNKPNKAFVTHNR